MNSRTFKNHTLVGVLAGLILGVLFGLLVGNLALGVLFMVGVVIGGLALVEELGVAPRDLGKEIWRRLEQWRTKSRGSAAGRSVVTPVIKPSLEPAPPAGSTRRPPVQDSQDPRVQGHRAQEHGVQEQGVQPVREESRVEGSRVEGSRVEGPQVADPAVATEPVAAADEASHPAPPTEPPTTTPATTPARTVVLVAGVGQQAAEAGKARDLYNNPLVELNLQYAESLEPDDIFILSAKHHLLRPDERIEPYDAYLSTMKVDELKSWSDEVLRKLEEVADLHHDRFVILAANKYRKYLVSELGHVEVPTEGLSLSEQRDFLKTEADVGASTEASTETSTGASTETSAETSAEADKAG